MNNMFLKAVACLAAVTILTVGAGCSNDRAADSRESTFRQTKHEADSLYNNMKFSEAYNLYLALLDSHGVKQDEEKRLMVLRDLCDVSDLAGQKNDQMKWLGELLTQAKRTGNNYYQSVALMMMGKCLYYEGQQDEGIAYAEQAITAMAKTDLPDTDHQMHSMLNVLHTLYVDRHDYEHALSTDRRNVELTRSGTRWGSFPQLHQQDQRVALAKMASTLVKIGLTAEADSTYDAWRAVHYEGQDPRGYFIVDYLRERGRYAEAAQVYEQLVQQIREHGDTLGSMMNFAKWGLAEVLQKSGNYQPAASLYVEVLEINDTLKARQARANAQELAALYETHEKEQKLQQRKTIIICLGALAVLLVATILALLFYHRKIRQKNHVMRQAIDEMIAYREAVAFHEEQHDIEGKEMQMPNPRQQQKEIEVTDPNRELFLTLDHRLESEQLYLNPDLSRDDLCHLIGVDKNLLGNILRDFSCESNSQLYINRKRIRYAVVLMREHPQWTMAAIAENCGMKNTPTFNRIFRQTYGMTPTEYMKAGNTPPGRF